jgi:hypothetical protein
MTKALRTIALLLLLSILGVGGFYIYQWFVPVERPPEPAPAPIQAPPPAELPPPVLSGEPMPVSGDQVATLVGMERSVKSKRAADLTWEDAAQNMPLYEDDAVRTLDKASATISFGSNDVVEVDQNALVIIKPRPKEGDQNAISLALLSGDLLDSLAAKPAPEQAKAIAAAAEQRQVTIRPMTPAGGGSAKTRIALKTLPDRSTTVAAITGTLKVVTPKGQEVVLKEKEVTRVTDQGLVAKPRLLPGVPALAFPEDEATYPFQRKVPQVEMRWQTAERGRRYRVVVATDSAFRRVFADERVDGTSLTLRNLQPGTYYWRVRAQDADGFEGPYSGVRSVRAIYDDSPPQMAILSPPEMFVSPAPTVDLKGKTERGARVKVNGQKVVVGPDGSFVHPLALKEGVNLVTIEATDPAGNSEYGRRVITYKGAKRSTASVSGNR